MSGSALSITCSVLLALYGPIVDHVSKRSIRHYESALALAPDLVPQLTPSQQAYREKGQTIGKIIGVFFLLLFLAVTIPTQMVHVKWMNWSLILVLDPDSSVYQHLQIAGLCLAIAAFFICLYSHYSFVQRINYIRPYLSLSVNERRAYVRSQEEDVEALSKGIYFFVRDPEQIAFQWFSIGVFLISQSWVVLLLFCIIYGLQELAIVRRDIQWARMFGRSYYVYRSGRGGQFFFTCLNHLEMRIENAMKDKLKALRLQDGYKEEQDYHGDDHDQAQIYVERHDLEDSRFHYHSTNSNDYDSRFLRN